MESVAGAGHAAQTAKLKLSALLAAMLLAPALALFLLDDRADLLRVGWRALLLYLAIIAWPTSWCGIALYRLYLLHASPARRLLDRLVTVFCVAVCGLTALVASHPRDAAIASELLTFAISFVALGLCGLYWPLDAQESQPAPRRLLLRPWLRRIFVLLLTVAPLPLAVWLTRIDWLRSTKGSLQSDLPQVLVLALVLAVSGGLRWTDRIPARASRRITSDEAGAASDVEHPAAPTEVMMDEEPAQPLESTLGERGVLISRTCTTRREGMHGDMWLFPGGVLRIPLGWPKTLAGVGQVYDARRPTIRSYDADDFARTTTASRNLWIPREAIAGATLRRTIGYDELRVTLYDGRSQRLLWLSAPITYDRIRAALTDWLGERLVVR